MVELAHPLDSVRIYKVLEASMVIPRTSHPLNRLGGMFASTIVTPCAMAMGRIVTTVHMIRRRAKSPFSLTHGIYRAVALAFIV
jgi:hypothetical protein